MCVKHAQLVEYSSAKWGRVEESPDVRGSRRTALGLVSFLLTPFSQSHDLCGSNDARSVDGWRYLLIRTLPIDAMFLVL